MKVLLEGLAPLLLLLPSCASKKATVPPQDLNEASRSETQDAYESFDLPFPWPSLDRPYEGPDPLDLETVSCDSPLPGLYPFPPTWPFAAQNAYSWNGSWSPASFPLPGLFDDEYYDGHPVNGEPSPILPPGKWDYSDAQDDLAWWRGFSAKIGRFEMLFDHCGNHFGWRLIRLDQEGVDFDALGTSFEGSYGTDILDLGPKGAIHSTTGSLGYGPDVLIFGRAWSLDFRTGPGPEGPSPAFPPVSDFPSWPDDDLVVGGCFKGEGNTYAIQGATIHTGPGSDLVFIRDIKSAAVDLGNGNGGRTDALDPEDGPDVAVLRGNVKDTRVFGGLGNDIVFWFLDEMEDTYPGQAQGGNLFGGGGAGDAIWGDPGVDRLVLVIPEETPIVNIPPTPKGALLVMSAGPSFRWDPPTQDDPFARYCYPCGVGPSGRTTIIIDYVDAFGNDKTAGYVYVTAFEELQIGIGPEAKVYRIDDVMGRVVEASDLLPLTPPPFPTGVCGNAF